VSGLFLLTGFPNDLLWNLTLPQDTCKNVRRKQIQNLHNLNTNQRLLRAISLYELINEPAIYVIFARLFLIINHKEAESIDGKNFLKF